MKLSQALTQIRTGDCLLYRGVTAFSRAIQLQTHDEHSHAAAAVWTVAGGSGPELWVYESMEGKGVHCRPLAGYLAEDYAQGVRVEWYKLTDGRANRKAMAAYYARRLGSRYSRLPQLAWSFLWLPRVIRPIFGLPAHIDDAPFCSWYWLDGYHHGLRVNGIEPDDGLVPETTSPADLARAPFLAQMCELEPDGVPALRVFPCA